MRWQKLFADLEAQLEEESSAGFEAEVADRIRGEIAKTSVEDRLRGCVSRDVALHVAGVGPLSGVLRRVGPTWLIVDEPRDTSALVAIAAVTGVRDLPLASRARDLDGAVNARIGLGHVLGLLCRDRSCVWVRLLDGGQVAGTIDRVGSDYIDIAEHPADEVRRPAAVRAIRTVPFRAIAVVRTTR